MALPITLLLLNSCVSTVTPPNDPEDACRVFVVDEPYHAGVVLPDDRTGGYVEYGYGEWNWYALEKNSWYNIFDTILWSTTGCLRRRELRDWMVDREEAGGRLTPVVVNAAAARDLLEDLDEMFDAGRDTLIHHHGYDMDFVQVERGYWFWYNCNDVTAEWLERLGCDVSGAWIRTALRIGEL